MSIIELRNVKKRFGENKVLKNISFKIRKGDLIGVKGESGAGKTTLLKLLIGFSDLDDGEIYYKFKKEKYNLKKARGFYDFYNHIGFSCQEGSFYDDLSVHENLDFYAVMHGLRKGEIDSRIKKILATVNLVGKGEVLAGNLSAGMQKRLDIACSLVHEPAVVFLDEPTAHLDRDNQQEVWKLVRRIKKKGITVVVTSHFPKDLKRNCDKVYELKKGVFR
ncbi:MAG: ABC transporter ATP-binding protein [Nanoarchaeota archaeon]|nr:ABC transporter ATP-binding protein [Nanoarchaeota archaeon]